MNPAKTTLEKELDYGQNPQKTQEKQLVSCYQCNKETAAEEFALAQQEYARKTGRNPAEGIIAYQIRQAFKPGEITPEECQKVGYETAMRFTKGKHAFVVCTHVNRHHLHNHIYFNAVDLEGERKWKDFWFSALALQKCSDLICMEHSLSVVEMKAYSEREKHIVVYPQGHTMRGRLKGELNMILAKHPKDMDELLDRLRGVGYHVKLGKHIAVKGEGQERFIRLDSLGEGYTQKDLLAKLEGRYRPVRASGQVDLLIDLQRKIRQGKGVGYQKWAERYNLKQMAEMLLFLKEEGIHDVPALKQKKKDARQEMESLKATLDQHEVKLKKIQGLKNAVFTYGKLRNVWLEYKNSGYSKRFADLHSAELQKYKNACKVMEQAKKTGMSLKIKDLNKEYDAVLNEKKTAYKRYAAVKDRYKKLSVSERNVEMMLDNSNAHDTWLQK